MAISSRPTPVELENLTQKHDVEFAVTYQLGPGVNGGGGQYYLFGISVSRGATSALDVNSARVILVRDASMPTGYKILTGFPTKS